MATDWSQFKPVQANTAAADIDWGQFKPVAKPLDPGYTGPGMSAPRAPMGMLERMYRSTIGLPMEVAGAAIAPATRQAARGTLQQQIGGGIRAVGDAINDPQIRIPGDVAGVLPSFGVGKYLPDFGIGKKIAAVGEGMADYGRGVRRDAQDAEGYVPEPGSEEQRLYTGSTDAGVTDWAKYAGRLAGENAAPTALAIGAGAATRSPTVGLGAMAPLVYGGEYDESREKGRTVQQSAQDATVGTAIELASERIPLGIALNKIGNVLPKGLADKLTKSIMARFGAQMVVEPSTEVIAEIGQMGYDAAAKGEEIDADAVWKRLRDAGLAGATMAAPMAVAGAAGDLAGQQADERTEEFVERVKSQLAMVPEEQRAEVIRQSALPGEIKARVLGVDLAEFNAQAERALDEAEITEKAEANAAKAAEEAAEAERQQAEQERLAGMGLRAPVAADLSEVEPMPTEYSAAVPTREEGEDEATYGYRAIEAVAIPESLAEDHPRMFKMAKADAVADVAKLRLMKEGRSSDNSSRFMALAREGKLPKRDPVDVRVEADGSYTVIDGNGTVAAAKKYGWKQIPVRIVEAPTGQEGWRVERGMLKGKDAQRLTGVFEKAQQIKPQFDAQLTALAEGFGVKAKIAGLKGRTRTEEKALTYAAEGRDPVDSIGDILRGTLVFDNLSDATAALEKIGADMSIVKLTTQLDPGAQSIYAGGYRDAKAIVQLENGTKAEIQINLAPMIAAKDQAHKIYTQYRKVQEASIRENRSSTAEERAELARLDGQMQAVYAPAWEAATAASKSARDSSVATVSDSGDATQRAQSNRTGGDLSQRQASTASSSTGKAGPSPSSTEKNLAPEGGLEGSITEGSPSGSASERKPLASVGQTGAQPEKANGTAVEDQEETGPAETGGRQGQEEAGGREAGSRSGGRAQAGRRAGGEAEADGRRPKDAGQGDALNPEVEKAVASIKALINPEHGLTFEVLSEDDATVEPHLWDENGNWDETTTAFFDPANNRVVVIAERQTNAAQTREDVTHEVTHAGLRHMLAEADYVATMTSIYEFAKANPKSIAGQFLREGQIGANYLGEDNITPDGEILFDTLTDEQKIELGDEIAAHMSERYGDITSPREKSLLTKLANAVRKFLRKAVSGQKYSDDEIYELINESRTYLRGKARSGFADPALVKEALSQYVDGIEQLEAANDPVAAGQRGIRRNRRAASGAVPAPEQADALPGAPRVQGFHGPDPRIVAVAEQYARDNGFEHKRQTEYVEVDEDRARRIADAYEQMEHAPQDESVRAAYADLIRQTRAQYDALVKAGYKFWFIDIASGAGQEYAGSPWNALRDMRANQRMGVFPTEEGFGSGATELNVEDNPLLAETGVEWPFGSPDGKPKRVLANDLFRAVHDAFGHGLEGSGFRAQGEENAWQAHVRLFTGPAVGAITSETRGQNSWLNYGPHGEANRTAKTEDTVFADQKTGLMPEWTWTEGRAGIRRKRRPATVSTYAQRIDELFAGAKPNNNATMIADEGDLLTILGFGNMPVMLNETHGFGDGQFNHGLTKDQWKKVPDWIENPVAVFRRDVDDHLTFVALDGNRTIVLGVAPAVKPGVHLTLTVYEKDRPLPLRRMVEDGLLAYLDQKQAPIFNRATGMAMPTNPNAVKQKRKVMTERNLAAHRAQGGADARGIMRKKATLNTTAFNGYTLPTERFSKAVAEMHGNAIRKYIEGINATGRKFRRVFQDDLYPLKTLEEQIEALGNYDKDSMNVYQRAELYYGRVGDRIEQFKRDYVKPFINALAKSNVEMSELEEYLYAKFAPVRNRKIYEANKNKPNSDEYLDGKSGMKNADAKEVIAKFAAAGKAQELEQLAQMVYAMNAYRTDLSEAAGLLSKEQADEWRSEPTYVPLKGFADGRDIGFETGAKSGKGFSISGSESIRAKGRDSRAADLIENVIAQAETTIIRAEKNAVAQAFVALVAANPNEELWRVERMKVMPMRDPETGEILEYGNGDPALTFHKASDRSQDIFIAKVSGKDYAIRLRGESGVMLAEAMKNMGAANLGKFLSVTRSLNRWLSMVRTTLNPEFVVANFARDIQTAMTNLTAEQGSALAKQTMKNIKPAMAAIARHEFEQPGKTDFDKYYEEMRQAGGKTDFAAARSVEEIQGDLRELIAAQSDDAGFWLKSKVNAKKLFGVIEALNSTVENSSRLAAYVAARKAGFEPKNAASLAKNLTVNFNRRGSAGPSINALYLFANASIQGTARFAQFVAKNPGKAAVAFMMPTFLLGFALSMINDVTGGDDEDGEDRWSKVPNWERDRNFVLMLGETKLKFPMPYVYNLPFVMGSRVADLVRGDSKPSTALAAIALNLLNSFNPLGEMNSLASALAPTLLDPAIDLERNKNFFDAPIRPENTFEPFPLPDSEKYFENTPGAYKWIAQAINSMTGGTQTKSGVVDISPTTFQYWADFWTGGTGAFFERGVTLIEKGFDEHRDVHPQDVPFLRTLVADKSERQVSSDYYKFSEDAAARKEQLELDTEQGLVAKATGDAIKGYGLTRTLGANLSQSEGVLRRLRKQRKLAKEQGNEDQVRAVEKMMEAEQARFNKTYVTIMGQMGTPVR